MNSSKQRLSDLKKPARGTIEAAIEGYLAEIATVRSRAKDGIADDKTPQGLHVRHSMSFFIPFVRECGIARTDEIETSDLAAFLAHAKKLRKTRTKRQKQEDGTIVETILDCGPYSETTVHGWMKDVRALMFFAQKRKYIKGEQPWDEEPMPSLPHATKRGMSTDEVATMLDLPNLSTREGVRDQALLTLTLDGGPRLTSIAKLVVGDVTKIVGGYRVHFRDPKNGKDLTVTLGRMASEAMQEWLRLLGEEDPRRRCG